MTVTLKAYLFDFLFCKEKVQNIFCDTMGKKWEITF